MFKRPSNRQFNEMREIILESHVSPYAEGSCMAKFGNTHVFCTASVDNKLPPWLRNSGKGWITAEYGMLPRSTHERMNFHGSATLFTSGSFSIHAFVC